MPVTKRHKIWPFIFERPVCFHAPHNKRLIRGSPARQKLRVRMILRGSKARSRTFCMYCKLHMFWLLSGFHTFGTVPAWWPLYHPTPSSFESPSHQLSPSTLPSLNMPTCLPFLLFAGPPPPLCTFSSQPRLSFHYRRRISLVAVSNV